jgi:hypothetical protein
LFLDGNVDFLAEDGHFTRGSDPDLHFFPIDRQDGNHDIVANMDALIGSTRQD